MKIHREGVKYIIYASLFWIVVLFLSFKFLFEINMVLAIVLNAIIAPLWFWIVWFFRLPERQHTMSKKYVVAPADGKVVVIEEVYVKEYFEDRRIQVSIFMSPLNVHINRCPIPGEIKFLRYHPGKYLAAWNPKASTENERTTLVFGHDKYDIMVRQIAGALAQRICCYVRKGDKLRQNDEFGFIRFGSRVDVFLPLGTVPNVKIGDKVTGGVTILATDVVDNFKEELDERRKNKA